MKSLNDFTGLYQVAETLTFELRPIGKTEENIQKSGLLQQDFKRAEDYPQIKKFLDEQHKILIQQTLSSITDIQWQPLADKITEFQTSKKSKTENDSAKTKNKDLETELTKLYDKYRKQIAECFKKEELYDSLVKDPTPSKLFAKILKESEDAANEIKTFARFACYFKGFQENRKNIYSDKAQQTAASYRAVNENFVKFYNAVKIFNSIQEKYPDLIPEINAGTVKILNGKSLQEIFTIEAYNHFLSQTGIDFLNTVIGEINYAVNQYRQKHKSEKLPFIPLLFKQILSDREQLFTIEAFENDDALCSALQKFTQNNKKVDIFGNTVELFSSLHQFLKKITPESDLFIDARTLDRISVKITGNWSILPEAMENYAKKNYKSKSAQEKYCKQNVFHLSAVNSWEAYQTDEEGNKHKADVTDFWKGEYASSLFAKEKELCPSFEDIISAKHKNLREDKEKVYIIKEYLDTVQEIFHLLKPLCVSEEYGGDLNLLGAVKAYYAPLEKVIAIYNLTRNYVTKKSTDAGKIKLMFDKPTLADGWDNNKEKDNRSVIFRKDDNFYLGIINPKSKIEFFDFADNSSADGYQKMVYKLLPGPNKMLPKVFFSKKGIETFAPGKKLLDRYNNNEHIKGDNFSLDCCHELIDYFKESISNHPDWSKFGFRFSPTKSYSGIDEFYKEITEQGYVLNFINIPEKAIDTLVNEGKLYLFQIWNKDFAEKSTGTPNKFTLYLKALFDQKNLSDVIFKLNGEAEIFIRKAVPLNVTHEKGSKLVNRTIVTDVIKEEGKVPKAIRQPIPEDIYQEIYLFVNNKKEEKELILVLVFFLV